MKIVKPGTVLFRKGWSRKFVVKKIFLCKKKGLFPYKENYSYKPRYNDDHMVELPWISKDMLKNPHISFMFDGFTWGPGKPDGHPIEIIDETTRADWDQALNIIKEEVLSSLRDDQLEYTMSGVGLFCGYKNKTAREIIKEFKK